MVMSLLLKRFGLLFKIKQLHSSCHVAFCNHKQSVSPTAQCFQNIDISLSQPGQDKCSDSGRSFYLGSALHCNKNSILADKKDTCPEQLLNLAHVLFSSDYCGCPYAFHGMERCTFFFCQCLKF